MTVRGRVLSFAPGPASAEQNRREAAGYEWLLCGGPVNVDPSRSALSQPCEARECGPTRAIEDSEEWPH